MADKSVEVSIKKMRKMLDACWREGGDRYYFCPACGKKGWGPMDERQSHEDGCWIARALKAAP
jgi:hypothetical protein